MMRTLKAWAAALLTGTMLVACGGGGGNAGSSPFGSGAGSGTGTGTGGVTGAPLTYTLSVSVQRAGTATSTISSTETVKAVARVADSTGKPVVGQVVTFSEGVASLIKFAPISATALTDGSGVATVDLSAKTVTDVGATEVLASARIGEDDVAGKAAIQIQAGSVDNTPPVPAAINFMAVSPADKAIVIKGAGGNGRSESATLTYQVVDVNNTPIKGARVAFSVTPAGMVTLNIPNGVSDANGLVSTTVQSGSQPATVTVTATAMDVSGVSVPSDQLLVSNGKVLPEGFEIAAGKYNLDYWLSGDSTTITARVRDASGNPVPDGVAVSFTTDYGVVASSTQGGCTTSNGSCTVDFRVQEPRGPNGIATITAKVRQGQVDESRSSIQINMAGGPNSLILSDAHGPATALRLDSCKQTFELTLADGYGHSAAAGTEVALNYASPEVAVGILAGSPVPDAGDFQPTGVAVQVDLTSTKLAPACVIGGTVKSGGFVSLKMTTPAAKRVFTQRFELFYPQF